MGKTCCFTGHRPHKFSFKYDEEHPDCERLKSTLKKVISKVIGDGYTHFISGMALGVDTWAAEIVLNLKENNPDVKLEAAIPCKNQECRWTKESQERYHKILEKASEVTYVSQNEYGPQSMILRDCYMVNNSDLVIAVFDGSHGGTKHTFGYALKLNKNIIRIDPKNFSVSCKINKIAETTDNNKVLECSTKGDKRFSAFCAKVKIFGKIDTIENHYQLAKRFGDIKPETWKDAKGKKPTKVNINGKGFSLEYLSAWYKLLWVKYFDQNPELVEYAKRFTDFSDAFKGKNTVNCQADVIKQYMTKGRKSIMDECQDLISQLTKTLSKTEK